MSFPSGASSPSAAGLHRRPRSRTAPAVAAALAAALTAAAVPLVLAQETPQDVLQSVAVDLGTDGTVHRLVSTDVTRSESGSETEERVLDPRQHADALPVRVTTSYVHDGKVGTDLEDLDGVDGLVEVNVTVQNTTVRPQRFRYDAAGVPRDSYGLVGTPLTVVASATLPEESLPRLRRPRPGTTEPHTTNGVVSAQGDATTVQWASLLAPPRLSATTTFTFVEQAEDFRMPRLSLSVQPGLATDTSVSRLVGDAFGGSAALIGAEDDTIGLIADINQTLAQATTSLVTVKETLGTNAGEVGSAATSRLEGAAADIDAASAAVLADLESLRGTVSATVQTTRTDALVALDDSLQGLVDYLGAPVSGPTADDAQPGSCDSAGTGARPSSTLLGQLSEVSRGLQRLSSSSETCVNTLRRQLTSFIGDVTRCPTTPATTGPLVCQLRGTSVRLAGVAATLADEGGRILGAFDAEAAQRVDDTIKTLVTAVTGLQKEAAALEPGAGSTVDELVTALEALDAKVKAAAAASAPGSGGTRTDGSVAGALTALHELALARGAQLSGSIASGLVALGASICALPGGVAASQELKDYADGLRRAVDGQACFGTPVVSPSPATGTVPTTPSDSPTVGIDPLPGVDPLPDVVGGGNGGNGNGNGNGNGGGNGNGDGDGGDRTKEQPTTAGLLALVQADIAAWNQVAAATAPSQGGNGTPGPAQGANEQVAVQLQELGAQVGDALDLVRGAGRAAGGTRQSAGKERKGLREVTRDIATRTKALYEPAGKLAACSRAVPAGGPLNALERSFAALDCNQASVAKDLDALLRKGTPEYAAAATAVDSGAVALDATRTAGDTQLGTLLQSLTGQLSETAARQLEDGREVVAVQKARLDAQKTAAAARLDAAAQDAVGALAEQIASANQQQSAASQALQEQLQTVLVDLGSATDGRGLLGVIQDSAGQTGVRAEQVQEAARAAARFRGVRIAELGDAQLEQRTARAALQQAQEFPAFARDLPEGSSHSTVFTLRVRPVGE